MFKIEGNFVHVLVKKEEIPAYLKAENDIVAVFKRMTFGENSEIESRSETMKSGGKNIIDYQRYILKRMLVEWNLNIELEFTINDELTDGCIEKVLGLSAFYIGKIISEYEKSFEMDEEEEKEIEKQAVLLFSKNSKGVQNAHESISLFCVLGSFWEKFGLNYYDLKRFPLKEFRHLRSILSKEREAMEREYNIRDMSRNQSKKIVGAGGKMVPSRGIVTPLPGSPGAKG